MTKNELSAKKSWVAYLRIVGLAVLLLIIATPVCWYIHWIVGVAALVGSLLYIGYQVLYLRSYKLYFDDEGIWIYSGVFPWQKGHRGIKWRDVEVASWRANFWSWLFKSYYISVKHRFDIYGALSLEHVARGDKAAMEINNRHRELIENTQKENEK